MSNGQHASLKVTGGPVGGCMGELGATEPISLKRSSTAFTQVVYLPREEMESC